MIAKDIKSEIAELRTELKNLKEFVKILYTMIVDDNEYDDGEEQELARLNT